MKILDRYASAVHSHNLASKPETTYSDTDVLGAFGLAGRSFPLATALHRLLTGDNKASPEVVRILADDIWRQARNLRIKVDKPQSVDIAKKCLAWFRHGACEPCGGIGETKVPGTPKLSGKMCQACHGSGKVPFEKEFRYEHKPLARAAIAEMERELKKAGPEAMKSLTSQLDL